MSDPNGLTDATVALVGVTAYLAAELTGSKTARRVEAWASKALEDGQEGDKP